MTHPLFHVAQDDRLSCDDLRVCQIEHVPAVGTVLDENDNSCWVLRLEGPVESRSMPRVERTVRNYDIGPLIIYAKLCYSILTL